LSYADFKYYQDDFKGTLIKDEDAFRTIAERSSEFIDTVTFDRLADEALLNRFKEKIQKCCCALSELFFRRCSADKLLDAENAVETSETIGAYSVHFANPYDYVKEISLSDSDFRKILRSTALQYLGNTGLMFRGVE
jgi:hypothetical protein